MPQIVKYIEQIIKNGFAYSTEQTLQNGTANGHPPQNHSVYFDTVKFG